MLQLTNVRDLDTIRAQSYKYNFSIFFNFWMVIKVIVNVLSKVRYQVIEKIQSWTVFVNKCRGYCFNICFIGICFKYILFFSVGNIIYEHIDGVSLLCHESFCEKNGN